MKSIFQQIDTQKEEPFGLVIAGTKLDLEADRLLIRLSNFEGKFLEKKPKHSQHLWEHFSLKLLQKHE